MVDATGVLVPGTTTLLVNHSSVAKIQLQPLPGSNPLKRSAPGTLYIKKGVELQVGNPLLNFELKTCVWEGTDPSCWGHSERLLVMVRTTGKTMWKDHPHGPSAWKEFLGYAGHERFFLLPEVPLSVVFHFWERCVNASRWKGHTVPPTLRVVITGVPPNFPYHGPAVRASPLLLHEAGTRPNATSRLRQPPTPPPSTPRKRSRVIHDSDDSDDEPPTPDTSQIKSEVKSTP